MIFLNNASGVSILVPRFWSPNTAMNGAFGGITAPFARYGTREKVTVDRLNPTDFPPTPGTQSGILI